MNPKLNPSQMKIAGLQIVIERIDGIIGTLHSLPFDFARGTLVQRIITDLDDARATARTILTQERNNADPTKRNKNLNLD